MISSPGQTARSPLTSGAERTAIVSEMPGPLLVANWKMNRPPEGIAAYCAALAGPDLEGLRLMVAPPFPWLAEVSAALGSSAGSAAAQDCSDQRSGAFTGEVSAEMIAASG